MCTLKVFNRHQRSTKLFEIVYRVVESTGMLSLLLKKKTSCMFIYIAFWGEINFPKGFEREKKKEITQLKTEKLKETF